MYSFSLSQLEGKREAYGFRQVLDNAARGIEGIFLMENADVFGGSPSAV